MRIFYCSQSVAITDLHPQDCRHSLLSYCTHYASANSAAIKGKLRDDSIAALRITNYCTSPICPIKRPVPQNLRCVCMETLVRATKASEKLIDGFYHCNTCLADVIGELYNNKNIWVSCYPTEEGDENLMVCSSLLSTPSDDILSAEGLDASIVISGMNTDRLTAVRLRLRHTFEYRSAILQDLPRAMHAVYTKCI